MEDVLRRIARYEEDARIDVRDRLVLRDEGGLSLAPGVSEREAADAAELYRSFLPYCFSVEDVANESEPLFREGYDGELVMMRPTTPDVLVALGFADLPVSITEEHLWKAMAPRVDQGGARHSYGLPVELVKRLPWLLERPALLADHPSLSDRVIAVLPDVDPRGYPLIVPLKPDAWGQTLDFEGIITNLVLTVFGPDRYASYFGSAVSQESVAFIDSDGERRLAELFGEDPFRNLEGVPRDHFVRQPPCLARRGGRHH